MSTQEHRDFNEKELLTWARFLAISFGGLGLAYARERGHGAEDFMEFAGDQLGEAWAGLTGQGVEPAMLGMLLNCAAIGAEMNDRAIGPESGEITTDAIPGTPVTSALSDRFEVEISGDEVRAMLGLSDDELNLLYDIFGRIASRASVEYVREPVDEDRQRLILRAW